MAAVEFEGRITREIFLRAQALHLNPAFLWAVRLLIAGLAGVLALLYLFEGEAATAVAFGVLAAAALILPPIIIRRLLVWQYARQPTFRETIRGVVTAAGLEYRAPFVQGLVPWQAFARVKASDALMLVYHGPKLFNLLPREFFSSDADWEAARKLVLGNLPEKYRRV